jgi:hypothetical protein
MYLGSHHSLEFLSLACSGLGSGSDYVTLFYTYVTLSLWLLILLVWRIGFGVIGLELVWCDANSSRLCPVQCWKLVVCYHNQI